MIGPPYSPSLSLSIRSLLLPGVSIKEVATTPTGSVPKAEPPTPSSSKDQAISLIKSKSLRSSSQSPFPPTQSANHCPKAT